MSVLIPDLLNIVYEYANFIRCVQCKELLNGEGNCWECFKCGLQTHNKMVWVCTKDKTPLEVISSPFGEFYNIVCWSEYGTCKHYSPLS